MRLELSFSGHSINVLSVMLVINYSLFIAVLGLHCYPGFSLVAVSGGLLSIMVHGLLIVVASLFVAHSSCSTWGSVLGISRL